MKRIFGLSFIILLYFATAIEAQSYCDYCQLFGQSIQTKTIKPLEDCLYSNELEMDSLERANMYSYLARAVLLIQFRDKTYSEDQRYGFKQDLLEYANRSVQLSQNSVKASTYIYRRYYLMRGLRYNDRNADLKHLVKLGYKRRKYNPAVHLVTKFDGDFWLGFTGSISSLIDPAYKLVDEEGGLMFNNREFSASALSLTYLNDLASKTEEILFSLLRIESPLYLDIVQFGASKKSDKVHYFYRPEIGIGRYGLSLSYGINIFMTSGAREELSRHSLTCRGRYIF